MEITRHFTATTIIVYQNRTLLHLHRKLNTWLPVGGHIERDELPQDAARREVMEESGLQVKFYSPDTPVDLVDAKQLMRPAHIILENINQYHQHIDFVFYATTDSPELSPQNGEVKDLYWLTPQEFGDRPMLKNVKILCEEALQILGR
jgi:8-oxo-dGTP pyrophosphatase MutT (NUDIX family)